jgi:hypothetical protein
MIKASILTVLMSFSNAAFSDEIINLERVRVGVFEKHDNSFYPLEKFMINNQSITLVPGKPLLVDEEERFIGTFFKDFTHNGQVFKLKIEILKLKMNGKNPTYAITSILGSAETSTTEQTFTTLDDLDTINGRRSIRQDSSLFKIDGYKPFKLVAGFLY